MALIRSVAALPHPKAVMLGNHDAWWVGGWVGEKLEGRDGLEVVVSGVDGRWQGAGVYFSLLPTRPTRRAACPQVLPHPARPAAVPSCPGGGHNAGSARRACCRRRGQGCVVVALFWVVWLGRHRPAARLVLLQHLSPWCPPSHHGGPPSTRRASPWSLLPPPRLAGSGSTPAIAAQLDALGGDHVGYASKRFPALGLTLLGGRPFSKGGRQWSDIAGVWAGRARAGYAAGRL